MKLVQLVTVVFFLSFSVSNFAMKKNKKGKRCKGTGIVCSEKTSNSGVEGQNRYFDLLDQTLRNLKRKFGRKTKKNIYSDNDEYKDLKWEQWSEDGK